jgi:hypothetical protein
VFSLSLIKFENNYFVLRDAGVVDGKEDTTFIYGSGVNVPDKEQRTPDKR